MKKPYAALARIAELEAQAALAQLPTCPKCCRTAKGDENQEAMQRAMAAWKEGLAESYRKGFEAAIEVSAKVVENADNPNVLHFLNGAFQRALAIVIRRLRPGEASVHRS